MVFPIYRGYSTVNNPSLDTTIFDMELVKADLMNHFMTKLGDRPMRLRLVPLFGIYYLTYSMIVPNP